MKVTNSDTVALTGAAQATGAAAARAKTAATQKSRDYTQLSNLSGHLRGLTAEGRQTQLHSIAATVSSGHYKPASSAVSAKIIQQSMRSGGAA